MQHSHLHRQMLMIVACMFWVSFSLHHACSSLILLTQLPGSVLKLNWPNLCIDDAHDIHIDTDECLLHVCFMLCAYIVRSGNAPCVCLQHVLSLWQSNGHRTIARKI